MQRMGIVDRSFWMCCGIKVLQCE